MKIGIIEGFYGEPWGWEARSDALQFLDEQDLKFYVYAPKADAFLRARWRDPYPTEEADNLRRFAERCADAGIAFGVGLTPLALHDSWDNDGAEVLTDRVAELSSLGATVLAVLFDDMRGDLPSLAQTQADIVHLAAEVSGAAWTLMCPTYYSDAPILDRLFGERPANYLETLGAALDPSIGVFWTGPKVVSASYPLDHIQSVTARLGRKPVLWDNYPVNDGPRMSRHLHLRAPDRPAELIQHVEALAINPMNQPWLSRVPIRAMSRSLRGMRPTELTDLLPFGLARQLSRDVDSFQDVGSEAMGDERRTALIDVYSAFDHPAATEVVDWLRGRYKVSADVLTDES